MKKYKKIVLSLVLCLFLLIGFGCNPKTEEIIKEKNLYQDGWWNMSTEVVGPRKSLTKQDATKEYFISVDGNDSADGSLASPFRTIEKAKSIVREDLKKGVKFINVNFREGVYSLNETVVFGLEDGVADGRVTYKAYNDEEVTINSDEEITGFRLYEAAKDSPYVPENLRGKVYVAESEAFHEAIRTLYQGEKMLKRSSSPGFVPTNNVPSWHNGKPEEYFTLHYPEGMIKNWSNVQDVEVSYNASAAWSHYVSPIESVNEEEKTAILKIPASYAIAQVRTNRPLEYSVRVENAIEFLKDDLDWAINTQEGKIYIVSDTIPENIYYPKLQEYFKVEGGIDVKAPSDTPVENISFCNLTFNHNERFDFFPEYKGLSLQHAWDIYDFDNAMLRVRGGEGIEISNCRFIDGGGSGIRFDTYNQNNVVSGNLISDLGGVGILFSGYGPGNKDVSKYNQITNNYITRIGQIYESSPAIFVCQSGYNLIANNTLTDLPYVGIAVSSRMLNTSGESAELVRTEEIDPLKIVGELSWLDAHRIYYHGRNNIVEYNDISDVTKRVADGNAIYVSGTGVRNIVRYNYVHNIKSSLACEMIRCDDDQRHTAIYANIISNYEGYGEAIQVKGKNDIVGNIVHAIDGIDIRNYGLITVGYTEVTGAIIKRNIILSENNAYESMVFDQMYGAGRGEPPSMSQAVMDENLYYCTTDETWGATEKALHGLEGVDTNSWTEDPQFYNAAAEDYRLLPTSPMKNKIEELDLIRTGVQEDFKYANETEIARIFVRVAEEHSLGYIAKGDTANVEIYGKTAGGFLQKLDLSKVTISTQGEYLHAENNNLFGDSAGLQEVKITLNGTQISTSIWVKVV